MFHSIEILKVLEELKTSYKGLSEEEAKKRLETYGLNELKKKKKFSALKILFQQFNSIVVYILVIALIISVLIGEQVDAVVIGIILVLNALLGFVQEFKAEKSIEALKKLAGLRSLVIRDTEAKKIDSVFLVPGDIILLETGDKIPADARLLEVVNLETQEASLTGESMPIPKSLKVLDEKTALADKTNMIFSGTIITKGRGKAVVTSTGMTTELGKIATLIEQVEPERTHLQKKLDQMGRVLGIIVIAISVMVFLIGILKGENISEFFILAVALAVAAIPEGLPAVVTIGLSIGTQRMIKRNALIRKLPSVETLGSTTVICSDKTGTLTKNEMTVKKIYANNKKIEVTGSGYNESGDFLHNGKKLNPDKIFLLLKAGALNNNSSITDSKVLGDPTEAALLISAAKFKLKKEILEDENPRIGELQFTSERKLMTTINNEKGKKVAYTKGAPEILLNLCSYIYNNGKITKLTDEEKKKILEANQEFANNALRVLGFAVKTIRDEKIKDEKEIEKNMTFLGLQAMIDPPRDEVKESIKKCKNAGIKVVMITGDHQITAKAIGKAIGIEGKSINGSELEKLPNLENIVEDIAIYSRVNPEHKIKIVDALKKKGHIVAMTGDGVNDAPALKKADIGVGMGITGTDVAKEASSMILTDDNFASIVNAVEEGRGIYENIKKFVEYLLSSNLGEIFTLFIAILFFKDIGGNPLLPLIPIMILWINLVTDGLPALALSVDPTEPNIMNKKPRNPKKGIISGYVIARMLIVSIVMTIGTLYIFKISNPEANIKYAQTMAFSTLMILQMFNVINCRSEFKSIFKIGLFTNIKLLVAIFISIIAQLIIIQTPFFNGIFDTVPLNLLDWIYITLVSSSVFIAVEIYKFIITRINPDLG